MSQSAEQKSKILPTFKKLYVKTWGCQMNVYDTRRMQDSLRGLGYQSTEDAEDADMVILNTCHIREKATDKVFSDLGRLRDYKSSKEKNGGQMIIAVAGCVAQAEGDVIMDRAKYVDMVFGPQNYHQLPEMVANITNAYGKNRIVNTDFPIEEKFDYLPEETQSQGAVSFISIQEGCDKFCTFCVVPYTRGSEFSRAPMKILTEAKRAVDMGSKEINLLGQNVNAYHGVGADGSTWNLGRLLYAVSEIKGLERIRYTTSHPRDVDDELINAHRDIKTLMPILHLPVQSGSDAILKTMNRKHTAEFYMDIIAKLRAARPDIAFSSDFIVGFPGETDKDFEDTMDLVRNVGFAMAYSFKYSPRPGTPATNMQGLVHPKIQTERLTRLQRLIFDQQQDFNDSMVGKTIPILFEKVGNISGQIHGRSAYYQATHVNAPSRLVGQIVDVNIKTATMNSLTGEVVIAE
jgi:tRNA-2-methylthio-N6-dimethylallyladenosine synthase